jgi:hypothetical protein
MRIYKTLSFGFTLLFAAVGIIFLSVPDKVLSFFNTLSSSIGMVESPVVGWNFYVILAAGYMYLVTILAFLMFRHPENRDYPLLLTHAKLASSFISLVLFVLNAHYLIYLANFIIDGAIGILVLTLAAKTRRIA